MSRPEDRYIKLRKRQLKDGRIVYASAIPIAVETTNEDVVIEASETDRIDGIAHRVYGSPLDWWRIAAANKKVNGSIFFKPGQKVIIPKA